MKFYDEDQDYKQIKPAYKAHEQEFGCEYCWDNRTKKDIDLYFFDRANNMRLSNYCPYCGRKFDEV